MSVADVFKTHTAMNPLPYSQRRFSHVLEYHAMSFVCNKTKNCSSVLSSTFWEYNMMDFSKIYQIIATEFNSIPESKLSNVYCL